MIEKFAREELQTFKFPELYVDHVSGRLPVSLNAPEFFGRTQKEQFERGPTPADEKPFWREVLEYNARLGASRVSLEGIEALSTGKAVPVVTGQQPGLLGGPLYTLYKVLTCVSLSELLSRGEALHSEASGSGMPGTDASCSGARRVIPVFWNASDDSDFPEVSSATLFEKDLSLKKLSVVASHHVRGNMVGTISTEALSGPIETLMHDFEKSPGLVFLMSCLEDGLSVARDWGEFFSAFFLRLLSSSGLVVVDARLRSVAECSRPIISAYLGNASSIEARVSDCLKQLRERGYSEPVSTRSGETCVFLREGAARKKVSKEELPAIADLWQKGEIELLPNVLLGPVARDELMGPVANVVGPSEASYYIVARALYDVLGLRQRSIFPRLSLTVIPQVLTGLVSGDSNDFRQLVLNFEKVAQSYFEKHFPPDEARELEISEREMRSAFERMARLASASGKSTEEVAASAARKINFELGRIREGFVAAHKRKLLAENPILRKAGEFLLPMGALQERSLCSIAPLVHGGESFISALEELARTHVRESIEGHVQHYVASVAIP